MQCGKGLVKLVCHEGLDGCLVWLEEIHGFHHGWRKVCLLAGLVVVAHKSTTALCCNNTLQLLADQLQTETEQRQREREGERECVCACWGHVWPCKQ